jgi:predicted AlkP superfamily pyrophosphatase or phosphodiesterase
METRSLKKLSIALFVSCIAVTPILEAQTYAQKNEKPVVVVITLDGFPARALKDPRLPMPTLRKLIAQGVAAEAMRPVNPTVTWPNHTAIITGVDSSKNYVMANGLIEFPPDESEPEIAPWVDKDKLVHAHTLYEAATEKGMTTGQVDWVAIYGAKGVTWEFGEKPDPNGQIAKELVAQNLATSDQIAHFSAGSTPAWHDEIWTDAAVDIIEKHTPNLMLLHLLETDSIQHQYGPLTPAAYASYAYADTRIARVMDALQKAGVLDRTTFFILSDHGFASFSHSIHLNAGLVEQGLVHKDGNRYKGSVLVKEEGGAAEIFIRDANQRATLVPKLKSYFASLQGIAHVYTNEEARAIGLPSEKDTDQAPQLYLTATHDYAFSDEPSTTLITEHAARGTHGYLNTESDVQALFVASGAHIRSGVQLGAISNLRVAPTIAKILGVELPAAQEKPLTEILK